MSRTYHGVQGPDVSFGTTAAAPTVKIRRLNGSKAIVTGSSRKAVGQAASAAICYASMLLPYFINLLTKK